MSKPINHRLHDWLNATSEADIARNKARLRLLGDRRCGVCSPPELWIAAGYKPPMYASLNPPLYLTKEAVMLSKIYAEAEAERRKKNPGYDTIIIINDGLDNPSKGEENDQTNT